MADRSKKTWHAHGCRRCRTRYDDNCTARAEDDLCPTCRGAITWRLLIDNRAPKACCLASSRLVTKDEKAIYLLGGRSNWHICATCRRTHPFKPSDKESHL